MGGPEKTLRLDMERLTALLLIISLLGQSSSSSAFQEQLLKRVRTETRIVWKMCTNVQGLADWMAVPAPQTRSILTGQNSLVRLLKRSGSGSSTSRRLCLRRGGQLELPTLTELLGWADLRRRRSNILYFFVMKYWCTLNWRKVCFLFPVWEMVCGAQGGLLVLIWNGYSQVPGEPRDYNN